MGEGRGEGKSCFYSKAEFMVQIGSTENSEEPVLFYPGQLFLRKRLEKVDWVASSRWRTLSWPTTECQPM